MVKIIVMDCAFSTWDSFKFAVALEKGGKRKVLKLTYGHGEALLYKNAIESVLEILEIPYESIDEVVPY